MTVECRKKEEVTIKKTRTEQSQNELQTVKSGLGMRNWTRGETETTDHVFFHSIFERAVFSVFPFLD